MPNSIPLDSIQFILMPVIAAQMLLMVLAYFVFVQRRKFVDYRLYACFLVSFIVFLLCRSLREFYIEELNDFLLFFRLSILFSIGIPSLLLALLLQSKVEIKPIFFGMAYLVGMTISCIYVINYDASHNQLFASAKYANMLNIFITDSTYRDILIVGVCGLLVCPCGYLIYKQFIGIRNQITLCFLFGAMSFAGFFLLSMFTYRYYWMYCIGPFITACLWSRAVYLDINEMKGKTLLLTEELNLLIHSGNKSTRPDLDKVLRDLESESHGNLEHYKLKIREILNLLTDSTITAGADTNELLQRNAEKIEAIKQSNNPETIRRIAASEVLELSEIIAEIPKKRSYEIVENIKKHIEQHYQEQLDIADLAEQAKVSESYLMRIFKKETNQTINQFMTYCRIERAKILLRTHSVTETAFAVGFNDANYFSTVFKKATDNTPASYQKSLPLN